MPQHVPVSPDNIKKAELKKPPTSVPFFSKENLELGMLKSFLVFPTQPFQVAMRLQQAALAANDNPRVLSAAQAFSEIYKGPVTDNKTPPKPRTFYQTMHPFFKGGAIGGLKEGMKNTTYKVPLIHGAPVKADSFLKQMEMDKKLTVGQYSIVKVVLSGLIASSVDVAAGGILDNVSTFLATAQGKNSKASILDEFKAAPGVMGKLAIAYRGLVPAAVKSAAAFTAFFATNDAILARVRLTYGLKEDEKMPWHALMLSAVASGTIVSIVSSPPDIAKTQKQAANSKGKKLIPALVSNYQSYGLVGMTAGLPIKFGLVVLGWGLNFAVTQRGKSSGHSNDKPRPESQKTGAEVEVVEQSRGFRR